MFEDRFNMERDGFAQSMLLRGAAMALWSKNESQEALFTELANAGVVGAPWVCWA
jgi:hypothetical protein